MKLIVLGLTLLSFSSANWGFFAHQRINRLAVFSLPPEMIGFYKHHIRYITEKAINPDQRRYVMPEEAPRHYIDLDVYGDSAAYKLPRYWFDAVEEYSEDTLQAYGIVPWHVNHVKGWLTNAFKRQDKDQILGLSADLGHYIADANVPLHTTENYNGQFTDQYGIHGFWESRLPELFAEDYQFFVGKAEYIPNTQLNIWDAVIHSNLALDSVFRFEKELTEERGRSTKYVIEQRGNSNLRTYSQEFSKDYHDKLNGMVERRMKASIKMIADFWYTCWVDGGQPDLDALLDQKNEPSEEELANVKEDTQLRNHESGEEIKN
ncbi:MAG: S1/P1 Nuclease [Cytophagales bacterium]|nr:S1/P1 Nuclease [Cytophagales bacterium]